MLFTLDLLFVKNVLTKNVVECSNEVLNVCACFFFSFLSDDPSLLGRSDGHDGWRRPAGGRETDLPDPDPDPDPVTVTETETETVTARSRWWLQCALRLW